MPEEFGVYKFQGRVQETYGSPAALGLLREKVASFIVVKLDHNHNGEKPTWVNAPMIEIETGISRQTVRNTLSFFIRHLPQNQKMVQRIGKNVYFHRALAERTQPFMKKRLSQDELEYLLAKTGVGSEDNVHDSASLEAYYHSLFEKLSKIVGWSSLNSMATQLGVDPSAVERHLPGLRTQHPEWFSLGDSPDTLAFERFSSALVSYLRDVVRLGGRALKAEDILAIPKPEKTEAIEAPDGWRSLRGMSQEIGKMYPQFVAKMLDEQVEVIKKHQWAAWYKDKASNVRLHFSPDCIQYLKEKYPMPPEGWLLDSELRRSLSLGIQDFNQLLGQYLQEFPKVAACMSAFVAPKRHGTLIRRRWSG